MRYHFTLAPNPGYAHSQISLSAMETRQTIPENAVAQSRGRVFGRRIGIRNDNVTLPSV